MYCELRYLARYIVAKIFWCGGTSDYGFITHLLLLVCFERVLKIGKHLAKLRVRKMTAFRSSVHVRRGTVLLKDKELA